nr:GldG family protein [Erythrobacter ani]
MALLFAVQCSLAACESRSAEAEAIEQSDPLAKVEKPRLGLMTSLPLYWPLGAQFGELLSSDAPISDQRQALEARFELLPLDTLSPIAGLSAGEPDLDPLEGLERLAVIQPRGLSPADNVALDAWVRGGGRLLLVLDPMLTADHHLPLGDPRRPVDIALIPPVVGRWGLEIDFDEDQPVPRKVALGDMQLSVALAGGIRVRDSGADDCDIMGDAVVARCRIGEGEVTLIADAHAFEGNAEHDHDHALDQPNQLSEVIDFAFR